MKKNSCHGRATCDPHGLSKITGESTKNQQFHNAGHHQASKKKSWKKRYLTFLSKFQSKITKHKMKPDTKAASGFKQKCTKRGILLSGQIMEECSNLVQVIRQATADCFAATAAADVEDEHHYMQLDQVTYGVKREAFGPVYLVT